MKQAFKLDDQGFAILTESIVVSDEVKKETVEGISYWVIDVDGLFKPRLVDGKWVEGAEEAEKKAAVEYTGPSTDERITALESALLDLL